MQALQSFMSANITANSWKKTWNNTVNIHNIYKIGHNKNGGLALKQSDRICECEITIWSFNLFLPDYSILIEKTTHF